jgi:hypothetical protein
MQTQQTGALIIDIKEKSFKGRDGEKVTFKQARILDDVNEFHQLTVDKDCDLPDGWEEMSREELPVVMTIDEATDNNTGNKYLKKRLLQIG